MQVISGLFFFLFCTTAIFSQPNPRHLEEVTFDEANHKLLVFGGIEMKKDGWNEPAMVYEWDGNRWQVKEAMGPVGRRGHVWLYDESQKRAVLMGGVTTGVIIKDSILFDVWTWAGGKWIPMNTTCPVKEPEAVFDPVNKRILVYGDANNKDQLNDDLPTAFELWEYKNTGWKKLSTGGPDITGSRMLAFDVERKRLVVPVFEENEMTVWEWTSKEWTKIILSKEAPVYRSKFAIGYDPVAKVTLLFGGLSGDRVQLRDFWKWDGKKWTKIETTNGPLARNSAHFVTAKDQVLLFGGSVPKNGPEKGIELSNELWIWKNGGWELLK